MIRKYKQLLKDIDVAHNLYLDKQDKYVKMKSVFTCGNHSIDLENGNHKQSFILFMASIIRSNHMAAKELGIEFTDWTDFKKKRIAGAKVYQLHLDYTMLCIARNEMNALLTLEEKRKLFIEEDK